MQKLYVLALMCAMLDLSAIAQEQTVTGTLDGHDFVDLGLPSGTLWATCNIGAEKPEEYGNYFAWGETTGYNSGKGTFCWSTYTLCNGSSSTLSKYCTSNSCGMVDNKTELDPEDDAAYVNWGSDWRMPSKTQLDELRTICNWTWATQNSVTGHKITGKNGNSVFLPAAGDRDYSSLYNTGWFGYYWTRTLYSADPNLAYRIYFNSGNVGMGSYYRCYGQSIRPVRNITTE